MLARGKYLTSVQPTKELARLLSSGATNIDHTSIKWCSNTIIYNMVVTNYELMRRRSALRCCCPMCFRRYWPFTHEGQTAVTTAGRWWPNRSVRDQAHPRRQMPALWPAHWRPQFVSILIFCCCSPCDGGEIRPTEFPRLPGVDEPHPLKRNKWLHPRKPISPSGGYAHPRRLPPLPVTAPVLLVGVLCSGEGRQRTL